MAKNKCPVCNTYPPSNAELCPSCDFPILKYRIYEESIKVTNNKCPACETRLLDDAERCPECEFPIYTGAAREAVAAEIRSRGVSPEGLGAKMRLNKLRNAALTLIAVIILVPAYQAGNAYLGELSLSKDIRTAFEKKMREHPTFGGVWREQGAKVLNVTWVRKGGKKEWFDYFHSSHDYSADVEVLFKDKSHTVFLSVTRKRRYLEWTIEAPAQLAFLENEVMMGLLRDRIMEFLEKEGGQAGD